MSRRKRHRRCLANIERLERELFPEWFKQEMTLTVRKAEWLEDYPMAPGARWPVSDPADVHFFGTHSALLMRSAAYKREITSLYMSTESANASPI